MRRFVPIVILTFLPILGCRTATSDLVAPPRSAEEVAASDSDPTAVHPEIWPVVPSPVGRDAEIERRVDEILARMSIEEKVGQTIQAEILNVTPEEVRRYHLGSVLSGGDSHPGGTKHTKPADWVALADAFWNASMDTSDGSQPIPVIWGADAVHGNSHVTGATIFPHNIGLGATANPELIRQVGEVTAREMALVGLDWDFGPTVAVVRNDLWGRTYEGYSEDPEIVRAYGRAMVLGLQGEPGTPEFLDAEHVIATAKHFLGDGGNEGGRDQGDNLSTEEQMRDIHGAGYVGALGAGVQSVMASFSSWHGKKMHQNRDLLTGVLKERMGFDGFIVGDWNAHGQIEGCTNGNCPIAFNAGIDMFMVPTDWRELWENTLAQAKSGEIPKERLDDAVRRILRVKMRAGLFERGRPSSRPLAGRDELLGSAEHRAVAAQAVRESLVLLKNEGRILPLRPKQRVLVAGRGADNIGMQAGGWTLNWQGSGNVNSDFPGGTSLWDGVRAVVEGAGGTAFLSADGTYDTKPEVAIVAFGEEPYAEFRGDLTSLEYRAIHPGDLELLRKLRADGIAVVTVFFSGRALWVNPELNASNAFVAAWLPGSEGKAIADVLFRKPDGATNHDFRGKLSYSWPRRPDQAALNRGDEDYDPLFPYGFGLTYSDEASLPRLSEESGQTGTAMSRTVYYEAGPTAPWRLYLGDDQERAALEVIGTRTSTVNSSRLGIQPVDRRLQGDARRARWDGTGLAWLFLEAATPVDLSREANGELSLSFDVLVEEPPAEPVMIAMGCGAGCRGALDLTEALRGLPLNEWQTIRIRLRCFEDAGAVMANITRPFELSTDGALTIRLSDVRLAAVSAGESICPGGIQSRGQVMETIERVADWQLAHIVYEAPLPDGGFQKVSDTEWVRGAFFTGVMAAWRATGEPRFLKAAIDISEKNGWQPGPRPRHGDEFAIAQTYAELYLHERDDERIRPTIERLDAIVADRRPGPVVGWREVDNWSWCDALFMAPPTFAMISRATGDPQYLDTMNAMWWETSDYLYDPEEHLYYRDGRYVLQPDGSQPLTGNGKKIFWSRGNGWVFAGLARVLEHMPADYPARPRFEQQFREMASALVPIQGRDGLWRSSLLDLEEYPAPETSGSAFFAYGLAWGINQKILDRETYLPTLNLAWRGLNRAVHPSGKLGWVQQIGYDPRSTGPEDAAEYGAGAFLLAASEIARM